MAFSVNLKFNPNSVYNITEYSFNNYGTLRNDNSKPVITQV